MCVAIYKPANIQLTKKTLHKCFLENSDGAGFAYLDENGHAVISKGYFSFGEFWRAYREHMPKEAIIHFRWATHGTTDKENCHPFALPGGGALIHNGVISWADSCDIFDNRSDTRTFVDDLLSDLLLKGNCLHEPGFKAAIEGALGLGNKLVCFHKGKPVILNEQQGDWKYGAWFSNLIWETDYRIRMFDTRTATYNMYANYAYGQSRCTATGYGEEEDEHNPWVHSEDEEVETERVSLRHIYSRCEICGEWKLESGMVSIGAEKACPDCFEHVTDTWDDSEIEERVDRYVG